MEDERPALDDRTIITGTQRFRGGERHHETDQENRPSFIYGVHSLLNVKFCTLTILVARNAPPFNQDPTAMITPSILAPTRSRTAREANRPQVSWTCWARCSRLMLTTLIVWAGLAIMPRLSSAGSITYTWQNEDGPPASGDLVVNGDAQANGQIQFTDVLDFNFMVKLPTSTGSEEAVFATGDLLSTGFPTPISTVTAGPTATFFSLTAVNSYGTLEVEFDQNWNLLVGQGLALTGSNGFNAGSEGQWIISFASVPEPSTLTLSAFACVFCVVYVSAQRRGC